MEINNIANWFLIFSTVFLFIVFFTFIKFFKFKIKHKGIGKDAKLFKKGKNGLVNNSFESSFSKEEKQKYIKLKIFLIGALVIWLSLLIVALSLQATIGGGFNVS